MRKIIVSMLILCLVCLCGIAMADTLQLDPTITSGDVTIIYNAEGIPDTNQDYYVIDYNGECQIDSASWEGFVNFTLHKGWYLSSPQTDLIVYVAPDQYIDHTD